MKLVATKEKKIWSNVGLIAVFTAFSAATVSSVIALRQNNILMLKLRDAAIVADESGGGIDKSLSDLQKYVSTHMNSTPPKLGGQPAIQLKSSYERAKAAEKSRLTSERDRVANEAISYCEQALPTSLLSDRANCIIEYNTSRPITENIVVADLYRRDYISPRWTPDVAGFSIVASVVLMAAFVVMLISRIVAKVLF